jgi:hypothetical protein
MKHFRVHNRGSFYWWTHIPFWKLRFLIGKHWLNGYLEIGPQEAVTVLNLLLDISGDVVLVIYLTCTFILSLK